MAEPEATAPSEQQAVPPQKKTKRRTCKYVLASVPLLLALLVYNVPVIADEYAAYYGYGEATSYDLPPGIMDAFRIYDQDGDGFLDPYEFAPLGMLVRQEVMNVWRGGGGRSIFNLS